MTRWSILWLGFALSAAACPVCASETGEQVRALVFGPDFLSNLGAVAAPFLTLAAVAILLRPGAPR